VPSDLLRPRLVVSHLLVLTVAAACVWLGLWQLDRLDQVRTHNDRLAARLQAEPVDLQTLLTGAGSEGVDEAALEFRRVEVAGRYRPAEEVLQRGRSHQNQQGFHLLTPFELRDGGVVLVRRGWVPVDRSSPPVSDAAPPAGEVLLRGVLERPVGQPGFGPRDPDEGRLEQVFHTDTARLDRQVEGVLFPMVLRAEGPIGVEASRLPVAVGSPELDGGNHLSYALQWFSFAVIAVIGYLAWLRTTVVRASRDAEVRVARRAGRSASRSGAS
jgi:surfeit locus 1 family protein